MPAFFNGIFGHKPSTGVVSNHGQIPKAYGVIDTFLSTGPMSRYASDLVPMMKVLVKPDIDLRLDVPVNLRNLKIFYMTDDGGNPFVSPVHSELKKAQQDVIKIWKNTHGVAAKELTLKRMFFAPLIWSNKMASEPTAPRFAQELNECEGEVNAAWELLKWLCFKQSDHTLPAIGLALFERGIDRKSSMHKVCKLNNE